MNSTLPSTGTVLTCTDGTTGTVARLGTGRVTVTFSDGSQATWHDVIAVLVTGARIPVKDCTWDGVERRAVARA